MNGLKDSELLSVYAVKGSERAFAELVRRHVDVVYSAALRMVRDPHLAQDITQGAFVALSQHATQLSSRAVLSGWLHRTARNIAAQTVRTTERRRVREQQFALMNETITHESDDAWERIAPHLDAALAQLAEGDHDALMLRYFERKSAQEIAQILGITAEAAQKRVNRAVARLRGFFAQRGVTVGASALVLSLCANAVHSAPVGLAPSILTTTAIAGTNVTSPGITTALKIIAMTSTQKTLLPLALLVCLSFATYKAFHSNEPRNGYVQAPAHSNTNTLTAQKRSTSFDRIDSKVYGDNDAAPTDIVKLTADLRAALQEMPKSSRGTRSYPPENVVKALLAFGLARKQAFPSLLDATNDSDIEIRMRAIAAMGYLGKPSTSKTAQLGIVGDPAPEAKPVLWKILMENDPQLAPIALSSLRTIGFNASEIPELTGLMGQPVGNQLLRYLPEAVANIIETDPAGAAPFVSVVESRLTQSDPGVQFEAACALAKYEAARNPKILATLEAGLQSANSLQQLMALETLQRLGSIAEPSWQAVIHFAELTTDDVMKEIALTTAGRINSKTREVVTEVNQALNRQESITYWNEKLASGNYTREDLIDALKEPMVSVTAAEKIGEMGTRAKETVPDLLSALEGQDQTARDRIVAAIHKIDPEIVVDKVPFHAIASASLSASMALNSKSEEVSPTPLGKLLSKSMMGNSEWQTQQELVTLAKAILSQNREVYRAFADKLLELEPTLASLIPKRPAN